MFLINNLPFLFFSLILTSIFYISLISVFFWIDVKPYSYLLSFILFIFAFCLMKRFKPAFETEKSGPWLYLLLPYLLIIGLRFPIYPRVYDDIAYYLVAGEYTKNFWTNPHIFPTYAIYWYNALPLYYSFLIELIGLRLTFLLTFLFSAFWMISLNLRFKKLVKSKTSLLFLDFFFISFPFWPYLMVTHGTFMADFVSLVFVLEVFYQFVKAGKDKTFAFIALTAAVLVKHSSPFYVLPVFAYLLITNFKKFNYWIVVPFFTFISSYFIRLYYEIGNPFFGSLFNNFFKSPIAPINTGLNLNLPFGGLDFYQKLFWPLIAQFSGAFAEGFVSDYARYYFFLFLAFPYIFYFQRILRKPSYLLTKTKKTIFELILLSSFTFWSFHTGFARWVIPLMAVAWLTLILNDEFRFLHLDFKKPQPKVIYYLWYFLILALSLTSLKSDLGWRPYDNLPLFKQLYFQGWQLVGQDRLFDIKKEFADEFAGLQDYEVVAVIRHFSEAGYFYAYMASFYGKKIITSVHNISYYENLLKSNQISANFKEKLRKILQTDKILLVMDSKVDSESLVKNSFVYKTYQCERIGNFQDIKTIQLSQFKRIVKYGCVKKTN